MATIAFIGLGVMGYPMAGHLASAGHRVRVYNRTTAVAEKWLNEYSGTHHTTPKIAAQGADMVFMCVGNDDDVRSVCYGSDGALAGMSAASYLVDHTTASDTLAKELAECAAKQAVVFFDAPVSGGQVGAEKGELTIMCGGDATHFTKLQTVMAAYAKCTNLLGEVGAGQLAKMVNQICIGGLIQSLAEALLFAQANNLDADKLIATLSQGAAGSWQMVNRYRSMLDGDYEHGFAVDWMRKDLAIVKDAAQRMGLNLPLTEEIDGKYAQLQENNGGRWDTSSLLVLLKQQNAE